MIVEIYEYLFKYVTWSGENFYLLPGITAFLICFVILEVYIFLKGSLFGIDVDDSFDSFITLNIINILMSFVFFVIFLIPEVLDILLKISSIMFGLFTLLKLDFGNYIRR